MALLSESGYALLTESAEELLAENETGAPGVARLQGQARLQLVIQGELGMGNPRPLNGRATLRLNNNATLTITVNKNLQGQATLNLFSRNGVIAAPTGLGANMKIATDPANPERITDQALIVWFLGDPNECEITLQIDDGDEFAPAWTWLNPPRTGPAIIRIDSAEIPGDGSTHQITVRVRIHSQGRTGPWAKRAIYAKTPQPRTTDQPEWCEATLLRQGDLGGTAPLTDLTRVRWRHHGAVKLVARIPARTPDGMAWTTRDLSLGYADHDESDLIIEGVGLKLEYLGGSLRAVTFGVCAIGGGHFGPARWANAPVQIKEISDQETTPDPPNPDQIAGTAQSWTTAQFKAAVSDRVREHITPYPANGAFIVSVTVDQLTLKIKDIVRTGGAVKLDHLSEFKARWNPDRTQRGISCTHSPGFREGTRRGIILTDEEAKAAP